MSAEMNCPCTLQAEIRPPPSERCEKTETSGASRVITVVFAAVLAGASFVILRRFAIPTYWLVPVGALAGMGWVLVGLTP